MRPRRRVLGTAALMLLALLLGVGGGVLLDHRVLGAAAVVLPSGVSANAAPEFRLMAEAWNVIQQAYVDRAALESRKLSYGAISGMMDSLGDLGHSRFLTPEMVQRQSVLVQGRYEGIGVHIQVKDGHLIILAPMDGSPAQQAGLRPGDIILKVDGKNIADLPLDDVVGQVMGPAGTSVTLTILDPVTGKLRDVSLVRASIAVHNVSWEQLPGERIAHVRIAAFSEGVTQELQDALRDIQQKELEGLVLDLRSNPGGLLHEAVGTASQFLEAGNVLLTKDAQGQVTPVPVEPDGVAYDVPVVVLINGGTASAAEIVAGALQDAQRATLVGQKTFGTGTVLGEFHLSDGSALLLAVQEWLTPDGRVIWHQGLDPDEVVALEADALPLLPAAERDIQPEDLQRSGDLQLRRAVELLGGTIGQPAR